MLPAGQTSESGAPENRNPESRVLDIFGPNLIIESNGPVGVGGALAYQLFSITDKGIKYQQALHASGLATIEADQTLEIQTGKKNKSGRVSYVAMAHNGDMAMTAANGFVRIKGQNIVLDADNEIFLQGKKVTIGNADKTTESTQIFGQKIVFNGNNVYTYRGFKKIKKKGAAAFLRGFRALYLGLIFNVLVMGSVSLAAIKFGEIVLGLPGWFTLSIACSITLIYSLLGGLKAVIITDFIQFTFAMIGSVWAMIYCLGLPEIGGLSNLISHTNVIKLFKKKFIQFL